MDHFVYILKCADGTFYVGSTNNLEKRVTQHNTAKAGAHYTKIRRPVELVYFEVVKTLIKTRRREAEIKRWPREKKIELIKSHA
ncbi:MAG: GIY-YIG nuclease family protein [Candidatus Azambacteria bacterium]|nr:GIY-YIG nuclease family protein [Candidatus Azambacteria bacterium]